MELRQKNISKLAENTFDVLVIGGGINGAVSAAALAARGAKVALIDSRDFAGGTSQHSSNLAWGGIKYMESYDFGLVWNLCKSRNDLIRSYPSTVQEVRFLTTLSKGFRHHPLMLFCGTWLYWLFGRGFTLTPRLLSAEKIGEEEPFVKVEDSKGGVEYSDAYLQDNDARFVFNFIRVAMDYGCVAANYVECMDLERDRAGTWTTRVNNVISGSEFVIRSKALINAGGAYADGLNEMAGIQTNHHHVLSKGIHLIVDRLTPNKRVLAFFADDGRLFFAIPMFKRTCIGTTDTRVDSADVQVTDEDREFVLTNINKKLRLPKPLTKSDVIAERCGVRPLVMRKGTNTETDFLQLSRKHVVEVEKELGHLSIFGGKLTDCINVGNEVCDAIKSMGISLPKNEYKWYGEPGASVKEEFLRRAGEIGLDERTKPDAYERLSTRLWRRYGAHSLELLDDIEVDPAEGELLIECTEYLRCEVKHAAQHEMIVKLEDFLRRRSKAELVTRRDELRASQGLKEACAILFGVEAEMKYNEYFGHESAWAGGVL